MKDRLNYLVCNYLFVKFAFFISFIFFASTTFAQHDTAYLKILYARCMDFSEKKADSINYYAEIIEKQSNRIHFKMGHFFSLRLRGLYEEYKTDYEKAIGYYLQSLEEAVKMESKELEISELTDLAIVYSDIKEYNEARDVYLRCVQLETPADSTSLVDLYTNLGAIYNNLDLPDSALIFLEKGLHIGRSLKEHRQIDLSSIYNNLGNTYFHKKEYNSALFYFTTNFNNHQESAQEADLWVDCLNIADVYIEKGLYNSASKYADSAMQIAVRIASRSKEADSYSILAKLYQRQGDYKSAYGFLQKWYTLDTAMVNSEKNTTVARFREQYHARERENEKLTLQGEVYRQVFRSRIVMVVALALLFVVILTAWALITKRIANRRLQETNELIISQNQKLAELNVEKNALIGIVSHDLGTPFASIGIWSQVLQTRKQNLDEEQKKSIDKILEATRYGENMIRRILDVEKAEADKSRLHLENFDLIPFITSVVESFRFRAAKKNILLHLELPAESVYIMSDRELISRILENLLSNAIKFTPKEKNIWVNMKEEKTEVRLLIIDEGIGIQADEMGHVFSKYSKISSKATENEPWTGMGLSIVKRIVEELDGKIVCESEPGIGTVFTVLFKKKYVEVDNI